MDTWATAYHYVETCTLKSFSNKCTNSNFLVLVGDKSRMPVTKVGHSTHPNNPYTPLSKKMSLLLLKLSKILFMLILWIVIINVPLNMTNLVVLWRIFWPSESSFDVIAWEIFIWLPSCLYKLLSQSTPLCDTKDLVIPVYLFSSILFLVI